MCGFVGGTGTAWDYPAALETIAHRGPDASKLHLDGVVKVGFRRLSIIDLGDEANQPMFASDGAKSSEIKTYVIEEAEPAGNGLTL